MIPPRHTPDAVLHIRARLYRSRYPTLRTVRIAGDGHVCVDGTRRQWNVAQRVASWKHFGYQIHGILDDIARVVDALEVVR